MTPEIEAWSMTPEAQPYLQKYGIGSQGQGNDYSRYLMELIQGNQQNPEFQKQLLGYYLDTMDPANQEPVVDENKLATAQTLLSAGEDSPLYAMGLSLLQEIYPQIGQAAGGYGAPETYEDILRQKAQKKMDAPENLSRKDYEWQKFLMSAGDEQVSLYDEAKNKTYVPFDSYWKGTGAGNPFDASFWSPEARARAKLGYTDF